jgi:deoxyribonuclease V
MNVKDLHSWDVSLQEAIEIQIKLKKKIKLCAFSHNPEIIAGADVSFVGNKAKGAVVVMRWPDFKIIETKFKEIPITYPYIPTLLTFREAPALLECFKKLKTRPEVIIFDGQGIAHPRKMGLATHLGIILSLPSIGCAKNKLYGKLKEVGLNKGDFTYLKTEKGENIGVALRTREGVKPIYVSPGHKINIEDSIRIILSCITKYRLPQPIRAAHNLTKSIIDK